MRFNIFPLTARLSSRSILWQSHTGCSIVSYRKCNKLVAYHFRSLSKLIFTYKISTINNFGYNWSECLVIGTNERQISFYKMNTVYYSCAIIHILVFNIICICQNHGEEAHVHTTLAGTEARIPWSCIITSIELVSTADGGEVTNERPFDIMWFCCNFKT